MTDENGDEIQVETVAFKITDIPEIVGDPERLAKLIVQIMENLTLLNYTMGRVAELMELETPDYTDPSKNEIGGYL